MAAERQHVVVRGAREHNLKNVDVSFPRDSLTTFTGVSGSGKSSLAYHTIYQEGQRRFLESLSSYARQFLGRMEKPKVDHVEGLSPTVSIDQKQGGHSPRSTVGTLTEVLDYLRLLFARLGTPQCPVCEAVIEAWSVDKITEAILERYEGAPILVLAPVVRERKGEYRQELEQFRARGFVRARIDGDVRRLDEDIQLHRYKYHTIELVIDRLRVEAAKASRLAEAVEQALGQAGGIVAILSGGGQRDGQRDGKGDGEQYELFSALRACPNGHGALPELEPRLFSFNSPVGACSHCDGLGLVHSFAVELLVADASKSIRDGALACFTDDGRLVYGRFSLEHLELVGEEFGFDLDTPWQALTAKQRRVVLHGSGAKKFDFRWRKQGKNYTARGRDRRAFPGVIPHLESVYRGATARHLERYRASTACPECEGRRLNSVACSVRFGGFTLPEVNAWPVGQARSWFDGLELAGNQARIGEEVVRAICERLAFLDEVGLSYLALDRRADTLSGGEAQRIRLAAQVGSGLRGVLYVLDEPSIGLHARDQERLLRTLEALRDRGNTVCVVEHDESTMRRSDFVVDVGPEAGVHGGEVVVAGPPAELYESKRSLTGAYLRGERTIPVPATRRSEDRGVLVVRRARHHNLQNVDVAFPLGRFVTVTGVSGSGKSTLVNHVLKRALRRTLHQAQDVPGAHDGIDGLELIDKIIEIDQAPIGRTPRSNPATYTKLWNHVRDLFAALPESRVREYKKGRFSFNVSGGRCETCEGAGVSLLEMQFLAPVEVVCEDCGGRRFNPETLEITFKDKNVHDILEMSVEEAHAFFSALPKIERPLGTLCDVGLGYVRLGQTSTTLSGGEAQRVKLASELHRPPTGRTLYLLDEPTTGLHFEDIAKLMAALQRLVDAGNTVVVIEHNLDVIKGADWLIDMGPEGGSGGGRVVAEGTPEQIAKDKTSHTGRALAEVLAPPKKKAGRGQRANKPRPRPTHLEIVGARQNNLQNVNARLPLDRFSVVTGVSGSGKSSLAFDTLFNEGQRRFVESLSTYARRFLGRLDRAPVERLEGLGPAIAIDQRASHRSPRSTVATATEIHDYLRLLWARIGRPHCPEHGQELLLHSPSSIARSALTEFADQRGYVLAPVAVSAETRATKKALGAFLEERRAHWRELGFVRAMLDGAEHRLENPLPVPKPKSAFALHLVVDRVTFRDRGRLVDSVSQAAEQGKGKVVVRTVDGEERVFTTDRSCPECGFSFPPNPHPRIFSFNHHTGACRGCGGLGQAIACDPLLLMNRPSRPLFGGAISHKGAAFTFLSKRNGWYHRVAKRVASELGFDLDAPWEELDESAQQVLLHGAGEARYDVTFRRQRSGSSRSFRMAVRWKGLCTQVEEWYRGHDREQAPERLAAVMRAQPCGVCEGDRLQPGQRHVLVGGVSLPAFSRLTVSEALQRVGKLRLRKREREVAHDALGEVEGRLGFLEAVGLGYLGLDRSAATLSGGEAQRIRLAGQLGNRLVGVLYVLDEPTVGLHPRDTEQLLNTLLGLRDLGNTVVAVEHDEQVIRAADWVLDLGPGAGHRGGHIVAEGTPADVARAESLTGSYLRGELAVPVPAERREPIGRVAIRQASLHNLDRVDIDIPLGVLAAVTGVSGSGKSTLVLDVLLPLLEEEGADLEGVTNPSCVVVDQSPIGTTPASNPATYSGVMTPIRELFGRLPASRVKGFGPGRFSFNVRDGRCEACEGKGQVRVEMHFLADVWVTCEVCRGRRYNAETLTVDYRGHTIADVLELEVAQALDLFGNHPRVAAPLRAMVDVGLGYLRLGQPAPTLSGGEAQRLKLVSRLVGKRRGHTIHLLDEPTTGLHIDDVAKLVTVFQRLVAAGDSVITIEHHLDVIKCADHVIELGPEAGDGGGRIVVAGTPEEVAAAHRDSHTGRFLRPVLTPGGGRRRRARGSAATREAS
ncbi:MAG: excinuclease ABC subunit UvrA [Planctomycetota bacterium]